MDDIWTGGLDDVRRLLIGGVFQARKGTGAANMINSEKA